MKGRTLTRLPRRIQVREFYRSSDSVDDDGGCVVLLIACANIATWCWHEPVDGSAGWVRLAARRLLADDSTIAHRKVFIVAGMGGVLGIALSVVGARLLFSCSLDWR